MADLVIDDGVPSRGHRLCIFDDKYAVASARVGRHATFGAMAVIEFAGEYVTDATKVQARLARGPIIPQPTAKPANATTQWDLGKCQRCSQNIKGGAVVEVREHGKYHKSCFTCSDCPQELVGAKWKLHGQSVLCESCWATKCAPTCAGCAGKITSSGIKYDGKHFHHACIRKSKGAWAGGGRPEGPEADAAASAHSSRVGAGTAKGAACAAEAAATASVAAPSKVMPAGTPSP